MSEMNIWRGLTPAEEEEFKQWARDNYNVGDPINEIWHPVVKSECIKMNFNAHEHDKENKGTKETPNS